MTDLVEQVAQRYWTADKIEQLLSRYDRGGECWIWRGPWPKSKDGRASVWNGERSTNHYRAVWEALRGPIPKGAWLCHHCDNPKCANPKHLYLGNAETNGADMAHRKRHWVYQSPKAAKRHLVRAGKMRGLVDGCKHPKSRLSVEQVRTIFKSKERTDVLAERYGMEKTSIIRIRAGKVYRRETADLQAFANEHDVEIG